ncbi:hypothetical protein BKA80DRAFT_267805 [Phyllosticta citrichinensis]
MGGRSAAQEVGRTVTRRLTVGGWQAVCEWCGFSKARVGRDVWSRRRNGDRDADGASRGGGGARLFACDLERGGGPKLFRRRKLSCAMPCLRTRPAPGGSGAADQRRRQGDETAGRVRYEDEEMQRKSCVDGDGGVSGCKGRELNDGT